MKSFIQKVNIRRISCKVIILAAVFAILMIWGRGKKVEAEVLKEKSSMGEVQVVDADQYEIPEDYHFSAQIQKDAIGNAVTEFVPFGNWDNKDKGMTDLDDAAVITRVTDEVKKGQMGAWYYNVGTYGGTVVDLKCTIVDYKLKKGHALEYGWIGLSGESLGIYQKNLEWIEVRMEFYDGSTGEPLMVKSTAVVTDIDNLEKLIILSDYQKLMVSESCDLGWIGSPGNVLFSETQGKEAFDELEDSWSQVQVLFENDEFAYRFYGSGKVVDSLSELEYLGYSDCRLAPLSIGDGAMTVSDRDESKGTSCILESRNESFTCEVAYKVPLEHSKWFYDSFIVTSQLPEYLELVSGNVYTAAAENVTSQFYLREKDGKVTFEAKQKKNSNFYGKTYVFSIHIKVKEGFALEELWDGQGYSLQLQSEIEVLQGERKTVKTTNSASAKIDSEYINGKVFIDLQDELSGVLLSDGEFVLLEWKEGEKAYCEEEIIPYSRELSGYYCEGLKKTHENQGRYKVRESKIPENYTGSWEQEILVTENDQSFSFQVKNMPSGENSVRMTSIILKADGTVSEEAGSQEMPTAVQRGDRIQYHIYVERDSALSYKSGELILKNQIPEGAVYEKDSLNLLGEILYPTEGSTARISSVRLDKEGVLTWKINDLDQGEIAHVIFEIGLPEESVQLSDFSELFEGEKRMTSNELKHNLDIPELNISLKSSPDAGTLIHAGEVITYEVNVKNVGKAVGQNVILRQFIPDGTSYVEDSVLCTEAAAEILLAKEDNGMCKMIYARIPRLEVDSSVTLKLQVKVNDAYDGNKIQAYGEVREIWKSNIDWKAAALEKEGFKRSEIFIHKIEGRSDAAALEAEGKQPQNGGLEDHLQNNIENEKKEKQNENKVIWPNEAGAAKTGDSAQIYLFVILSISSVIIGIKCFVCIKRRKKL